MNIRTKVLFLFLALSLVPLVGVGVVAVLNGESALKQSLGSSFRWIANDMIERVDRMIYVTYQRVKIWAELDLMQDVRNGDPDKRISFFIEKMKEENKHFSSISVLNAEGAAVAGTALSAAGPDQEPLEFFRKALNGEPHIEDAHYDAQDQDWVVSFVFPIRSKGDSQILGVLAVHWSLKELFQVTQLDKITTGGMGDFTDVFILRSDGLVISVPVRMRQILFQKNLVQEQLRSAGTVVQKKAGSLTESLQGVDSLIGYSYSKGYRDFPGLGWGVLVAQDAGTVFAPIRRLRFIIFTLGTLMALVVTTTSILISQKMTTPILQMTSFAKQVAAGKLEGKIEHISSDEMGFLVDSFNQMIRDLRRQREELVGKHYVDSIIRSMIDALIVTDLEGNIQTINESACRLLEYRREELIGRPLHLILQDQPAALSNLSPAAKRDLKPAAENIYISKSGKKIPVSFSSAVLQFDSGEIQGIVCVAKDITEQKAFEEKITQSSKMAAVGQLAAGIAHELNNPLSVILGFSQLVAQQVKPEDAFYSPLKFIEKEAIRCRKLVQDLLTFSRAGKEEREIVNVEEVVEQALSLVMAQSKVSEVEFIKEIESGLPAICANRNQVQQVIINLCNNALDVMPAGGKLSLKARKTIRNEKDFVEIQVQDMGPGIPAGIQSRIFEPFFTTKEVGKGTGLGLSLVYEIIQKNGGSITFQTQAGKGTTFYVYLPTG